MVLTCPDMDWSTATTASELRSPAVDGPIYMLNLTRYLADVDYGRTGAAVNSQEPDGRYAPLGVLAAIGATLCFVADVVASPGHWHRVAVVGYPSRRSFVAMAARPDFRDWHHNKSAGIEQSVVMGTLPARALPDPSSTSRILLETWRGPAPARVADGSVCEFEVEGTLLGDGRAVDRRAIYRDRAGYRASARPDAAGV